MVTLADKISALLPLANGNPAAMIQLAYMLRKDGQPARAVALCEEAMTLASSDAAIALQGSRFLSNMVPAWHFSIVRDGARNAAYDAALRRAVRPRSRVLDIGSGTGLLAMMAARAGAADVVTCEVNPAIAQTTRDIVARNGYQDRVRVIAKHSDALELQSDLGGKTDILVSEIVSNDLLGEDVLPVHETAVRDFLRPGGQVIPARGSVRIALAEDLRDETLRLGSVSGFDLSPFNKLAQPVRSISAGHERLNLRGDGVDLFTFDFGTSTVCPPARTSITCRSKGGRANGVVQWIALEMDDLARYENHPGPGAASCWGVQFYPFARPIDTVPGQEIRICGSHDRRKISIWQEAT